MQKIVVAIRLTLRGIGSVEQKPSLLSRVNSTVLDTACASSETKQIYPRAKARSFLRISEID